MTAALVEPVCAVECTLDIGLYSRYSECNGASEIIT